MKITQFTDYSLRLMLYLAGRRERVVTVREVAEFYDISSEHLKKIVRRLSDLGYTLPCGARMAGCGWLANRIPSILAA